MTTTTKPHPKNVVAPDPGWSEQVSAAKAAQKQLLASLPSFAVEFPGPGKGIATPITLDVPTLTVLYGPVTDLASVLADRDVSDPVQAGLNDINSDAQTTLQNQSTADQSAAGNGAQSVKDANGTQDSVNNFIAQMNAQRDQTKANVDQKVDDWYAKAEQLGQQNPAQQQHILDGMQALTSGALKVLDGLGNALLSIANTVLTILTDIWTAVSNFFGPVVSLIASIF